jgi:hypothetical protein
MEIPVIVKNERALFERFDAFPVRSLDILRTKVTETTHILLGLARAAAPSRTGTLRSQIKSRIIENPNRVVGVVGLIDGVPRKAFGKAGALEYGSHKSISVKAHSQNLDHFFSKAIAPRDVSVRAYTRQTNIEAHNFLRGPLEAVEGIFKAEVEDGLQEALD